MSYYEYDNWWKIIGGVIILMVVGTIVFGTIYAILFPRPEPTGIEKQRDMFYQSCRSIIDTYVNVGGDDPTKWRCEKIQ